MQTTRTLTPSRMRHRALLRRTCRELFIGSSRFVFPFFIGFSFALGLCMKPLEVAVKAADKSYQQVLKVCQR